MLWRRPRFAWYAHTAIIPASPTQTTLHPAHIRREVGGSSRRRAVIPASQVAKCLLMPGIPAYSRSARNHQDRPVTPEVAGSSPVAPVENCLQVASFLPRWAQTTADFSRSRADPAAVAEVGDLHGVFAVADSRRGSHPACRSSSWAFAHFEWQSDMASRSHTLQARRCAESLFSVAPGP